MDERLIVRFQDVADRVREFLEDSRALLQSPRLNKLLGAESIASLRRMQSRVADRLNDKFTLVIMGDFKRGKSTLINALLGQPVATVNARPETVTINCVEYGEERTSELVLENGKRYRLAEEELQRERLEPLLREIGSPVDHMRITVPSELLRDVTLVDTPGLNDLNCLFDEKVRQYLLRADAILFVTSAISPLSQNERNFIASTLPQERFRSMFVVANLCDCLDEAGDLPAIQKLIGERVGSIRPDIGVYLISALHAYARRIGAALPNPDMAGELDARFARFEAALRSEMLSRRDLIQSDRLLYAVNQYLDAFQAQINQLDAMLRESADSLGAAEKACRERYEQSPQKAKALGEKLRAEVDVFKRQAFLWMDEFLARLRASIEGLGQTDTMTLEKHLQFFISDALRKAIDACVNAQQEPLEELVRGMVNDQHADLSSMVGDVTTQLHLGDIQWTQADSALFVFDYCASEFGLGLLNVPAYILGGVARKKQQQKQQFKLLDTVLSDFDELAQYVHGLVNDAYDQFCQQLLDAVTKRLDEEMSASIQALQHAQEIKRTHEVTAEQMREEFDGVLAILESGRKSIQNL